MSKEHNLSPDQNSSSSVESPETIHYVPLTREDAEEYLQLLKENKKLEINEFAKNKLSAEQIKNIGNAKVIADFSTQPELNTPVDLSGLDFSNAHLQEARFIGVNMKGCKIYETNFDSSNLQGVDLENAVITGSRFNYADLSRASLDGITIEDTQIRHTNLQGVDLENAVIKHSNLNHADLSRASLYGVTIENTQIRHTNLQGVDLENAVIKHSNLNHADLSRASLDGVTIEDTQMRHTNLSNTSRKNTTFKNTDISTATEAVPQKTTNKPVATEKKSVKNWFGFGIKKIARSIRNISNSKGKTFLVGLVLCAAIGGVTFAVAGPVGLTTVAGVAIAAVKINNMLSKTNVISLLSNGLKAVASGLDSLGDELVKSPVVQQELNVEKDTPPNDISQGDLDSAKRNHTIASQKQQDKDKSIIVQNIKGSLSKHTETDKKPESDRQKQSQTAKLINKKLAQKKDGPSININ